MQEGRREVGGVEVVRGGVEMKRPFDESRLSVSGPPASSRDGEREGKGVKDALTLPPRWCFD